MEATLTDTTRQQKLRKVAILVSTLGSTLGEQLLADLPAQEAADVRTMLDSLEEVDSTEYEAVVSDFRQSIADKPAPVAEPAKPRLDGVELDASLLARLEADDGMPQDLPQREDTWKSLGDADATKLAQLLAAEQPQTIAVVLSRLDASTSAELLTKLSPALQADVVARLAELDPANEQAVHVVESQLADWIRQQRQHKQRLAAGQDLVSRILQETPSTQRTALMSQLSQRSPALVKKLLNHSAPTLPGELTTWVQSQPMPVQNSAPTPTTTSATASTNPIADLEALDDRALLNALRHADRQTVMLALAGAGEPLLKRVVRGLPRRQANQFRQQVRSVGPTRLSDMLAAQRELVRCSNQ